MCCLRRDHGPLQGKRKLPSHFYTSETASHGLKFESVADSDKFLFQIHLHRRTEQDLSLPILYRHQKEPLDRDSLGSATKMTVVETIQTILNVLRNKGHFVVADRYYGLKELLAIQELGLDALLKYNANRPTALWEQIRTFPVDSTGYVFASSATVDNDIPFYVYCRPEEKDNLLSTVEFKGFTQRSLVTVNQFKDREVTDVRLHESSDVYNLLGNCVDAANRSILECNYGHRKSSYKVALLCFFLQLIAHNARILHEHLTQSKFSQKMFLQDPSNRLFSS